MSVQFLDIAYSSQLVLSCMLCIIAIILLRVILGTIVRLLYYDVGILGLNHGNKLYMLGKSAYL